MYVSEAMYRDSMCVSPWFLKSKYERFPGCSVFILAHLVATWFTSALVKVTVFFKLVCDRAIVKPKSSPMAVLAAHGRYGTDARCRFLGSLGL